MGKMNNTDLRELCHLAIKAARAAGEIINAYRERDFDVEYKAVGDSAASQVVTEVDRKAQQAIIDILQPSCNKFDLALVAEETSDDGLRQQKSAFWCIDPMDGTLAFIKKIPGFSVSIALVAQNSNPLIGVVYDPLEQNLYHAIDGQGAWKNGRNIHIPGLDIQKPLILQTDLSFANHTWLKQTRPALQEISQQLGLNGSDIHFKVGAVMNACSILEQPNTCYFKFPRKNNSGGSIWDYAATACLFNEAGAVATDITGLPMDLNRAGSTFMNHRGLLYVGHKKVAEYLIQLYEKIRLVNEVI